MWKNVKKGFGFAIGYKLGASMLSVLVSGWLRRWARDDEYMEGLKDRRPDLYETLEKYKPKKESVEENEEGEVQ